MDKHKTHALFGVAAVSLLLLGAGCSGGTNETTPAGATAPAAVSTRPTKTFTITAQKFAFDPSTIEVNEGDEVVLNISSVDVTHGFSLSDFSVSEALTPGKTTTVRFVADKKGTFSFVCSVICGEGHGTMKGTLIVK